MNRVMAGCLVLLFISFFARADMQPLPELKRERVIDSAGLLTRPQFAQLNRQLTEYELSRNDGSQFVVFIVPSTGGESIETFAHRAFNTWKIGRKGQNNGLLLVVAVNDRNLRFEIGYGLEGILPDVSAGRIIRHRITPEFKNGYYFTGIEAGVTDAIDIISGNEPGYITSETYGTEALQLKRLMIIYILTFITVYLWSLFIGSSRRKKRIEKQVLKDIEYLREEYAKSKSKKKRQPGRAIHLTQKRLTAFLQYKYIYPAPLGHTVSVLFYSVLIFIMTRVLADGDPDPDALFISIMILVFLNVFGSLFLCFLLYAFIPGYRIQEAEMRKLTGVMAGAGGGYSSGSDSGSYSSSSGGSSGSSGSSGGGGGCSGGGGASGSW
ncbi:TPM domain-containing protein [Morganella morganii]|uniref:TPM domain-containing protein n=1 Tax=Morganella morganii TaxID=582 RepID=UPI000D1E6A10|nr:TPM domain-containing protein [Morganella morganii]HAE76704.1 methanol dehydrogenase [Morganella sp. (in: enterobacteria)]QXO41137.1 TPM domain-containing protein [Morganella morganii]QXO44834.1 TPM domain-containing protein [Morganella morganii]QXO48325.1 TPM domain-containing protein [Morganella morganii]QXO52190.1 TPM domain-containing protein [Morganella morganii]